MPIVHVVFFAFRPQTSQNQINDVRSAAKIEENLQADKSMYNRT